MKEKGCGEGKWKKKKRSKEKDKNRGVKRWEYLAMDQPGNRARKMWEMVNRAIQGS